MLRRSGLFLVYFEAGRAIFLIVSASLELEERLALPPPRFRQRFK